MDIKKDNAMYMQIAQIAANRSYAQRLKVGCVIVKNNSIISFGWNGMLRDMTTAARSRSTENW